MTGKDLIIFVGGAIVGGVTGVLCTKHYYRNAYSKLAAKEILDLRSYIEQLKKERSKVDTEPKKAEVVPDAVKAANDLPKIDYNAVSNASYKTIKITKEELAEDPAEAEYPRDDGEAKYNSSDDIYEIDQNDYAEGGDGYEAFEFKYFPVEDVMVNDDGDRVDYETLLGDLLDSTGFKTNRETFLFVRNASLHAKYVIEKEYRAYGGKY